MLPLGKPTTITTPEAARQLIENRFQDEYARNGYGYYLFSLKPVVDAETTSATADQEPHTGVYVSSDIEHGKFIDTVSLTRGKHPNAYTIPDMGFAILPEQARKGYAIEASKRLLAYAEEELNVHDILGLHDPTNEASIGVFRSFGFVDRGVRALKVFGNVQGAVWLKSCMLEDLSVYGL